jgi:hypothetical protein
LTLLTGTITSLLKIDTTPIDGTDFFVHKFTAKMKSILANLKEGPLKESITLKIKIIL